MKHVVSLFVLLALTACGSIQLPQLGGGRASDAAPSDVTVAEPDADTPRPDARPGEDGDPSAAVAPGVLGTTLATLGDATVAGLWIETPLVSAPGAGRVTAQSGAQVDVQLIPSGGLEGSGSRLSLAAMQALGLALTAIAEVRVEAL